MKARVLAFDIGASSGRAMLAVFDGETIRMEEIHRFANEPVQVCSTLYWDILRLYHEVKQGILLAARRGPIDSIGIDTWGVDFGLLDENGQLLQNPVHYRDNRTQGVMEEIFRLVAKEDIYRSTGIQFMEINTIAQLYALQKQAPHLLQNARSLLLIPDLLNYFLTRSKQTEYTNASTTQLLDANKRSWDSALLQKLGLPTHVFSPVVAPATLCGQLSDSVCQELGVPKIKVFSVGSHDTASAVAAVPAQQQDFIYISCGTWSLFGTELASPIMDECALHYNFTNEGGIGNTIRYLKNIMGLWLIQEARRQWMREGEELSYADLEREGLASPAFESFIDPDHSMFVQPGDIPGRVREYCRETGQPVPETRGQVMRCIYQSIALRYRQVYEQLTQCTGKQYRAIHVVGGGTKDNLLCQMAANACGLPVLAGPREATVLGNIAVQLMACGQLESITQARRIIAASQEIQQYAPCDEAEWQEAYRRFRAVTRT